MNIFKINYDVTTIDDPKDPPEGDNITRMYGLEATVLVPQPGDARKAADLFIEKLEVLSQERNFMIPSSVWINSIEFEAQEDLGFNDRTKEAGETE